MHAGIRPSTLWVYYNDVLIKLVSKILTFITKDNHKNAIYTGVVAEWSSQFKLVSAPRKRKKRL